MSVPALLASEGERRSKMETVRRNHQIEHRSFAHTPDPTSYVHEVITGCGEDMGAGVVG